MALDQLNNALEQNLNKYFKTLSENLIGQVCKTGTSFKQTDKLYIMQNSKKQMMNLK